MGNGGLWVRWERYLLSMYRTSHLFVALLFGACGRAETGAVDSVPVSTVDVLRGDLRQVMTAQERYYSMNGSYAATLELLRDSGTVELTSEGTAQLIGAPDSYSASITKSVGPNASVTCRVEVGNGRANDGKVECE